MSFIPESEIVYSIKCDGTCGKFFASSEGVTIKSTSKGAIEDSAEEEFYFLKAGTYKVGTAGQRLEIYQDEHFCNRGWKCRQNGHPSVGTSLQHDSCVATCYRCDNWVPMKYPDWVEAAFNIDSDGDYHCPENCSENDLALDGEEL